MNTNRPSAAPAAFRTTAIIAGVLLLITDVTSIAALPLYGPILNDPNFITGTGPTTGVLVGILFEIILALAALGTGVALYPVFKRYVEGVALGWAAVRTLEAAVIAIGVIPLLAVVTLRQSPAGADPATLTAIGSALVSFHNWTFMLGPGMVYPVAAVLMGIQLYRSRLAPRFIPVLCFIGGTLVFATNTAKMFGILDPYSPWLFIAAAPALAWELSLAFWMIFKGFNQPAAVAGPAALVTSKPLSAE